MPLRKICECAGNAHLEEGHIEGWPVGQADQVGGIDRRDEVRDLIRTADDQD